MSTPAASVMPEPSISDRETAHPYARQALTLLIAANFFNYLDRYIVSVLGTRIQQDLHITDAQLGFVLGTAFAVLYGVFGIAMGRIADALSRPRLMAVGLALWSAMTALSGFAGGFAGLAVSRIGVGIGEAVANPCSQSLLCDYFPARRRATVLGAYLGAVSLGLAGAFILGGLMLQKWSVICTALPFDACRLADWRAAFFMVGIPGVLLAILIVALPEPRTRSVPPTEGAVRLVLRELSTAIPPFTSIQLFVTGGARAMLRNLGLAVVLLAGGALLAYVTGDWAQWAAVAVGAYAVSSWAHILRLRDAPLFAATFGSTTFMLIMAGGALINGYLASVSLWSVPFVTRTLNVGAGTAGVAMGLAQIVAAGAGVVLGGMLTDRWRRRDVRAPLWIGLISLIAPIPMLFLMLLAKSFGLFMIGYGVFAFLTIAWAGGFSALSQELVAPRMRASAAAIFSLVMILIGTGIGPYVVGKISTMTGSLTAGLYGILGIVPIAVVLLVMAASRVPAALTAQQTAPDRL